MPCLVALLAMFAPRLAIFLVWLLSDYLGRAYHTVIWPVLGFLFMPYTTLAYAWAVNANGSVRGVYLAVVVLAVLVDLGVVEGGRRARTTVIVERRG
jgi:hypothetical protein